MRRVAEASHPSRRPSRDLTKLVELEQRLLDEIGAAKLDASARVAEARAEADRAATAHALAVEATRASIEAEIEADCRARIAQLRHEAKREVDVYDGLSGSELDRLAGAMAEWLVRASLEAP